MKISFIIVNYNVTELLKNCISSIYKYTTNINFEIIVIDNNSPDKSWTSLQTEFPMVKFIANPENSGFSKANNLAVEYASGEYLFFLNPDTEIEGVYLKEIIDFTDEQKDFGCLGLRMHDAKGNFLPESKRAVPTIMKSFEKLFNFFENNNSKSYYRNDIAENEIAEVEILTGANLLIKKEIYSKVGGFDEKYFMYGEDIDLCYSVLQLGFRNFYYGKYSILHHKGESTVKDKKYFKNFYNAMNIFIEKYYSDRFFIKNLIKIGIYTKYIFAIMKR